MYQIYRRTNRITNKVYVGSTSQTAYDRHFNEDYSDAYNPHRQRSNSPICQAIRDHGVGSFTVEVLAVTLDKDHAAFVEQHFMDKFNARDIDRGYNINRAVSEKRMAEIAPKINLARVQFFSPL